MTHSDALSPELAEAVLPSGEKATQLSGHTERQTKEDSSATGKDVVVRVAESDSGQGSREASPTTQRFKGVYWFTLVAGILSAQLLFSLDNTIVADIQSRVIHDLGEIEKLPWIIVAFELGAASANLFWGQLYGLFDNKKLFISSIVIFEVGSAICGAAPSMNALIVGRAICGLGGNGIYLGTLNIISSLSTIQERPFYLSLAGVAWSVGTVCGPIVGGAFSDSSATWRWGFYINICVGGALAPIYFFMLPSHNPAPTVTTADKTRKIDFIGATLFTAAFTAGIMAISFGGVQWEWKSGHIIGLFCCSGVLWIMFGVQQAVPLLTSEKNRLFPVHMLRSVDMVILFAQTASSIACLLLTIFFVPLYFQFVRGDNALTAGVRLLPLIIVGLVFSVLSGGLMGKLGYYMPWYLFGSCLIIVGASLMRTVGAETSIATIYGFTVVLAAGVGCFVQASFPVAQAKMPAEEQAAATAFIGCSQLGATALSFSVAYSIFLNTAARQIADVLPGSSAQVTQAAIAGVSAEAFNSLTPEQRGQVLQAVIGSFSYVWDQVLASGVFSLLLSLLMKREKLFLQP